MTLDDLDQRDNASIDNAIGIFERKLGEIVARAQARTLARIQERLTATNGSIDGTAGNHAVLRALDTYFNQEMDAAGFRDLVDAFAGSFGRQFDRFDRTLTMLGLDPVRFTEAERAVFRSAQLNAIDQIHGALARTAEAARQAALFSVGGVRTQDLAEMIAEKFSEGIGHATGVADTALTTFYRNIAARGFEKLAAAGVDLRFRYFGPRDKLNRPFCRRLLEDGRSFTRQEIDRLDNGQLPNVLVTAGGYRCRHQWIPLAEAPEKRDTAPPVAPAPKAAVKKARTKSPIPRVPAAAKKLWDAGASAEGLRRWARNAGVSTDEYASRIEKHLAKVMRDAALFIRIRPHNLAKVLDAGRFKTQHETGTSGGALNPDYRARVERTVMGVKKTSKPTDHPIYGFLSDDLARGTSGPGNHASMYGTVAVRLKSEVLPRTTFTIGDSLNYSQLWDARRPKLHTLPSPVTTPNFRTARFQKNMEAVKSVTRLSEEYTEAQIFGGVPITDIEEIIFDHGADYLEFKERLQALGIKARLAGH